MSNLDTSSKVKTRTRSPKSPTKAGIGKNSTPEESKSGDRERLVVERKQADEDKSLNDNAELHDLSEEEDELQDDEETGLTGKDKSKRTRKRRRNTLLDQRVAAEVKISPEEKKEADQNVLKVLLINGLLIGLWYIFSLSISIVCPLGLPFESGAC
jgi:solute carrier family 35 protein C2